MKWATTSAVSFLVKPVLEAISSTMSALVTVPPYSASLSGTESIAVRKKVSSKNVTKMLYHNSILRFLNNHSMPSNPARTRKTGRLIGSLIS